MTNKEDIILFLRQFFSTQLNPEKIEAIFNNPNKELLLLGIDSTILSLLNVKIDNKYDKDLSDGFDLTALKSLTLNKIIDFLVE